MNKKEEIALRDFHAGINFKAYEYFGAHKKADKIYFRVWAPSADKIYLCGDFNEWKNSDEMAKADALGVYEIAVNANRIPDCSLYKFKIINKDKILFKADPFAAGSQRPPDSASVYIPEKPFSWSDDPWLKTRSKTHTELGLNIPINIYELHLGSFIRHENGSYYTYRELAPIVASYVKKMGYTHIELMPVSEYPCDASWGYQVCGYYSPTSRFGSPDDFKYFVNFLHNAGIGVILDWVPAHFPKDEHGLFEFDGSFLYEYNEPLRRESQDWGTRYFDLSKNEVVSFLISNAVFWAEEFHIDGLRTDAVSSMIYLDFGKKENEWMPNKHGGNINFEAVAFLKKLNRTMKSICPSVLMIAEESSAYKGITDQSLGGLGFDLKWNMGWMNDSLSYFSTEATERPLNHGRLTFPMMYAFNEKHILPISHDEVVYGKRSLLDKMPGEYNEKFSGIRSFMAYMMTQPGKKLSFMSNEFGQFAEWNYNQSIEWFMTDFDAHRKLRDFCADLNSFYLLSAQLWQNDFSWDGFEWVSCDDAQKSVISYFRKGSTTEKLLCVFNFSRIEATGYELDLKSGGTLNLVLSTDRSIYGGTGKLERFSAIISNESHKVKIDIPPLCSLLFTFNIN